MGNLKAPPFPRWALLTAALITLLVTAPSVVRAGDPFDQLDTEFEDRRPIIADPLQPWNRLMFEVNDKLYFYALKPIAETYKALLPEPARIGVRNFFTNLAMPVRLVGCLLQGKSERAGAELGAFMVNSTVGVLGLGNPAGGDPRLRGPEEDVGQALARWGVGHGPYLVWPLFGPSSVRDSLGGLADRCLDPLTYLRPSEASLGADGGRTVNAASLHLGEYEALRQDAVAPYEAMRDAYVQYRQKQVSK